MIKDFKGGQIPVLMIPLTEEDWHPNAIFKPGAKGEGNEWVTFYALLALKHARKLKL